MTDPEINNFIPIFIIYYTAALFIFIHMYRQVYFYVLPFYYIVYFLRLFLSIVKLNFPLAAVMHLWD